MKVAQFFKTYIFHVVQIFTRPKDLKIFLNPPKLSFANKHNLNFKILNVTLSINISCSKGKNEKQNMHFNPSQNLKFCLLQKLFYKNGFVLFQNNKNTFAIEIMV